MFKTHLTPNKKRVLLIVALITFVLVLTLINLSVIIPGLLSLYQLSPQTSQTQSIDTNAVNQAIKLLNP